MENINTILLIVAAIIQIIVIILFIVMTSNVSKINKLIRRNQGIFIAWAKKEGITREKDCPKCRVKFEVPYNQPKGYYPCPNCGDNNYIDITQ